MTSPGVHALHGLAAAVLVGVLGYLGAGAFALDAAATEPVTFSKDIAPIVFDRCGQCHHPGGSAPFSLLTYAAVRQRATLVATVTKSRLMPPWKVEPGFGEFVGQRPLSDDEIGRIQRWVAEGAPEGDPRELPPRPEWSDAWRLGTPDLVVTLPHVYTLRADGPDDFRAFVIRLPVSQARYVRGLEFRPTTPAVHHADFALAETGTTRAEEPAGQILGWTAGQGDGLLPTGLAWRLDPGFDLVVQLHMQPTGKPEAVQASIGFYFTDEASPHTPAVLRLGRQSIDIAAGEANYSITDSYVLPVAAEVLAVRPHAHWRAREIKGWATLPDGTMKWLLYIKDWDFRWQNMYRLMTPLTLPEGTRLTMHYTYDNSADNARNPYSPPRRARWGPQTTDEMGDLWIQVLASSEAESALLNRMFARHALEESVMGYETLIEQAPADVALRLDVVSRYIQLDRPHDAIGHLEAVVDRTDSASALGLLAWLLATTSGAGLPDGHRAVTLAERAAALTEQRDPKLLDILAAAYAADGQFRRALETIADAIALIPATTDTSEMRRRQELYRNDQPCCQ